MMRTTARSLAVVFTCLLAATPLAAQSASSSRADQAQAWYGKMGKPKDFDPPKVFSGTFQIELPKEWQLAPGHTNTVFLVVEKTKRFQPGAAIALEYQSLQAAIDPSILANVGSELLKDVQARELDGTGFTLQVLKAETRSLVLIQYDRPNLSGKKDHVAQYSIPMGRTMYHLICIAPSDELDKYRPMFAYAAASFESVKSGS